MMLIPGLRSPRRSASATMKGRMRSLTLWLGLKNSSLPAMRVSIPSLTRFSSTIGVSPATSRMLRAILLRLFQSGICYLVRLIDSQQTLRVLDHQALQVRLFHALLVEALRVEAHRLRRRRIVRLAGVAHQHAVVEAHRLHRILRLLDRGVRPHRRDRAEAELRHRAVAHDLLKEV